MMSHLGVTLVATVAALCQIVYPADAARGRHRAGHARHVARVQVPRPARAQAPVAYGWADAPGAIVEQATARARREPGVTIEFDPSAKVTATGGPAGGVPSSSGGP